MPKRIAVLFFPLLLVSISVAHAADAKKADAKKDAANNTLTAKEKQEGWKLLFDGKDLKGWHSYMEKTPGKAWQVSNDAIFLNKNPKSVHNDFADLVTDEEYDNFDFTVEW